MAISARLHPREDDSLLEHNLRTKTEYTISDQPSRTVFALMGNKIMSSNFKLCAERRLLNEWIRDARKHNIAEHQIIQWILRKTGGKIYVWRIVSDGSFSCAVPCVFCKKELLVFGVKVICPLKSGGWFAGDLREPDAPTSKLTNGQRIRFAQK